MGNSIFPALYQVNTRVWMTELSKKLGRPATLDDIPDSELDQLARSGFDWVWLLSIWQTGNEGQRVSRENPQWRKEFEETLHDLSEEDIGGSGFAIKAYTVHEQLGGDSALARLRDRLRTRGLRLMLDFVPNHSALDHPWVDNHPEYYMHGNASDLLWEPSNYTRIRRESGDMILAYGRDPFFPGWPDTLQLNYSNPNLREAMIGELIKISGQCDGVRCDMAMLILPDVFERTWGLRCGPFWLNAIQRVRDKSPDFCFMAEVYWGLEWTLQQQGFDYTYDKRLYDRLKEGHARPVREHLYADLDYQRKLARFLENHDEPRAAVQFSQEVHEAAAIITFLTPGLRFFHQGQFKGKTKRISPHLVRGPEEPVNIKIEKFYEKLLSILKLHVVRDGNWRLLECGAAWNGNSTNDSYISFAWDGNNSGRILVVVNYSPGRSQCYVKLPFHDLNGNKWRLRDLFSGVTYDRTGSELQANGLFLDEPGWKYYVFAMEKH
ncbi:MAG TPA: alpha-amylase family glycosyl hydrolase [Cyclobacteriaceae bacterium]|nr:alpha-amylase family glycosyl hydrolase [Cyclobacteriaceae bacterium]